MMLLGSQGRGSVRAIGSVRGGTETRRLIDGRRSSHRGRMRGEAFQGLGNDTRGRHAHFASDLVDIDGKAECVV